MTPRRLLLLSCALSLPAIAWFVVSALESDKGVLILAALAMWGCVEALLASIWLREWWTWRVIERQARENRRSC